MAVSSENVWLPDGQEGWMKAVIVGEEACSGGETNYTFLHLDGRVSQTTYFGIEGRD